jgi:hypothetical protein
MENGKATPTILAASRTPSTRPAAICRSKIPAAGWSKDNAQPLLTRQAGAQKYPASSDLPAL